VAVAFLSFSTEYSEADLAAEGMEGETSATFVINASFKTCQEPHLGGVTGEMISMVQSGIDSNGGRISWCDLGRGDVTCQRS